ncbi:ArsR family transcriptional regulator [Halobium palmae]|uniref:ArsR family transcriptional regulator n=1 Tax=Halobium palmae TaxID=1776492 RepID=A0ABD5RYS7_9EURY
MAVSQVTQEGDASLQVDSDAESESTTEEIELSKDEIFYLLKNRRRRDIVRYLMDNDGTATLSELAEHIAAWENDIDVQALNSGQRKRVYVALYQTHLPKLAENGIIEYERNRGDVTLTEHADRLKTYLEDEEPESDPWSKRYAALSVAGAAAIGLLTVGGVSIGISMTQFTVLLTAAFLVASLAHTYEVRLGLDR